MSVKGVELIDKKFVGVITKVVTAVLVSFALVVIVAITVSKAKRERSAPPAPNTNVARTANETFVILPGESRTTLTSGNKYRFQVHGGSGLVRFKELDGLFWIKAGVTDGEGWMKFDSSDIASINQMPRWHETKSFEIRAPGQPLEVVLSWK